MKTIFSLAFCFCAVALVVGDPINWSERQTHEFRVEGATVVGIPLPFVQGEGIKISQTVKISRQSQFSWILQCSDISVKELRNQLSTAASSSSESSSEQDNGGYSTSSEEIDAKMEDAIQKALESPIEIVVEGHSVKHINVPKGTPRWAKNIFRGLVTQFHVVFEQYEIPTGGKSGYKVVDHLLFGKCPTLEDVRDVGQGKQLKDDLSIQQNIQEAIQEMGLNVRYFSSASSSSEAGDSATESSEEWEKRIPLMLNSVSVSNQASKVCGEGDSFYVIMKKVVIGECEKIASLDMGYPAFEINNDNSLYDRKVSLISFGCGMGRESFKTLAVFSVDVMEVGMNKKNLPSLKQISYQVATIKDVYPAKNLLQLQNPVQVNSLSFEFGGIKQDLAGLRNSAWSNHTDPQSQSSSESDSSEYDSSEDTDDLLEVPTAELIQRAKTVLREFTSKMIESRQSDKPLNVHLTMQHFRLVIKIIRSLPQGELLRLYESIESEGKSTNNKGIVTFLFNALLIAGTGPSLFVCDKLSRERRVSTAQIAYYLLGVPKYTRIPSEDFILMFKDTVNQLSSHGELHNIGLQSLASITYQSCVNPRIADAKYPTQITGRFCDVQFARREILPIFESKYASVMKTGTEQQKATVISAIGILGLPRSVVLLQAIIRDLTLSTYIRTKAVLSHKRIMEAEVGEVWDAQKLMQKDALIQLLSVARDISIPSPIRMASSAIIFSSPLSTYEDFSMLIESAKTSSNEFKHFISSSVETMATMNYPMKENHKKMRRLAEEVQGFDGAKDLELPNVNSLNHEDHPSMNIYLAEKLNAQPELGFLSQFSFLKSDRKDFASVFLSGSLIPGPNSIDITPIELNFAYDKIGTESLAQSEFYTQIALWNEVFVHTTVGKDTIRDFVQQSGIPQMLEQWYSSRRNTFRGPPLPFNVQGAIQPWEQVNEVPTVLGISVRFHMDTPLLFSTRGKLAVKETPRGSAYQGEIYIAAAGQLKVRMSLKVPHTKRQYQVGYERNLGLELPFRFAVQEPSDKGAFTLAITPTHLETNGQPGGQVRFLSYFSVPYTAIIQDQFATTIEGKYVSFDAVRRGPRSEDDCIFGQKALGMKFIYQSEVDEPKHSNDAWNHFLFQRNSLWINLTESETNTLLLTTASEPYGIWRGAQKVGDIIIGPHLEKNQGDIVAVAFNGKTQQIQSLSKGGSDIQLINESPTTRQYLGTWDVLSSVQTDGVLKVASGAAAKQLSMTLTDAGNGLAFVKYAISKSFDETKQKSACLKVHHQSQTAQIAVHNVIPGKNEMKYGIDCLEDNLHEISIEDIIAAGQSMTAFQVQSHHLRGIMTIKFPIEWPEGLKQRAKKPQHL